MVDPQVIDRMVRNEADMAYRRRVRTVFEWLNPTGGDLILDAGCGRGFYPNFIRHASSAHIVGMELELPYLRIAQKQLAGKTGITLINGNIYHLPFPAAFFDKIILSEVLEHLPDDCGALISLARVLKPGGLIAVTVPNSNYPFWWDPINKTLETLFNTHVQRSVFAGIGANHQRLYTADDLRAVVVHAGLEIAAERSFTHYSFPFIHNIVYGIGKELLEGGLLPNSIAKVADRHNVSGDTGNLLNPVHIGLRIFEWFDRRNVMDEPPGRSSVNLCILARKPA